MQVVPEEVAEAEADGITAVAHASFITALVFIVMQFVAFTIFFNKTYVASLQKALTVPSTLLAFNVTADGVREYKDVTRMCGVDEEQAARGAAAYMKQVPYTNVATWPDTVSTILLVCCPLAVAAIYRLRHSSVAQALFNGALICSMFTIGEIVGWLVVNVPVVQRVLDTSLDKGLIAALKSSPELCAALGDYYKAQDAQDGLSRARQVQQQQQRLVDYRARAEDERERRNVERRNVTDARDAMERRNARDATDPSASASELDRVRDTAAAHVPMTTRYNIAKVRDGTSKASRRRLWAPAYSIVLSCWSAAAILLAAGRARFTWLHCGREVLFTTILVGIAQWYFVAYTMTYRFYGSSLEGMQAVTLDVMCQAVGGPGLPALTTMPPSLYTAATASDKEIRGSTVLRTIFMLYAVMFVLLSIRLSTDIGTWPTLKSSGVSVLVAMAGWLTEAYFYQFVVADTTFVTWTQIETGLLEAMPRACRQKTTTEVGMDDERDEQTAEMNRLRTRVGTMLPMIQARTASNNTSTTTTTTPQIPFTNNHTASLLKYGE